MNWLLVVVLANTPVKTDLVYSTLPDCLKAEQAMRQHWVAVYNDAVKRQVDKDTLEMVKRQMGSGTCIPSK